MSDELPPESNQPVLSAESQEAFLRLMKGAQPVLLRYVMSLVGNRDDAEDVLQRSLYGKESRQLVKDTDYVVQGSPNWSANGKKILFDAWREAETFSNVHDPMRKFHQLYLVNREDEKRLHKKLAGQPWDSDNVDADWSPDEKSYVFTKRAAPKQK